MKKWKAIAAIACAAAVTLTGIAPAGVLTVGAYAAETTAESEVISDASEPTEADPVEASAEPDTQTAEPSATASAETSKQPDAATGQAAVNDETADQQDAATDQAAADQSASEATAAEEPSGPVAVTVADSLEELQAAAPAELNTSGVYDVDVSAGTAEGSDEKSEAVSEVFGVEAQPDASGLADAIEATELYVVDSSQSDGDSLVVYSPYARHRIIVYTDQEPTESYGATEIAYYTKDGGYRFCFADEETTGAAYDALTEAYGADAVVLDLPISLSEEEESIYSEYGVHGWGTVYMNLDTEADKLEAAGAANPVTVAILDTGVNVSHQAIAGHPISAASMNLVGDDPSAISDVKGHGTAVAGIIAEATPSSTELMVLRIANEQGESSLGDLTAALTYAAEHGADVANVSLNAYYSDYVSSGWTDEKIQKSIANYESYFQQAEAQGMITCVSAGNKSRDIAATYNYPALSDYAICTGAIGADGTKASFSDYGTALDFVAPGVGVMCADYESDLQWKSVKGTSFASPYTAAMAADLRITYPDMTREQAEEKLGQISKDLGDPGKDSLYGYGVPQFDGSEREVWESKDGLLDEIIVLPEGWEPDDPAVYKEYLKQYGEDADSNSVSEDGPALTTSSISSSTKWKIYKKSCYNSSTKKHSGNSYQTFKHDSKNTANANVVPVIDVSKWNDSVDSSSDNINWDLVKAEGVKAVLIRCAYRAAKAGSLNADPQFTNFIKGAKKAGLEVGVYIFSQAITESEGVKEAEFAIKQIKAAGYSMDLPVVIDVEYGNYYENGSFHTGRLQKANLTKAKQTAIAEAFCKKVKASGYTPMVYASSAFLTTNLNGKQLDDDGYLIWMARYNNMAYTASDSSILYQKPVRFWQCSFTSAINGISTAVDLNFWYRPKSDVPATSVGSIKLHEAETKDRVTGFKATSTTRKIRLTWDALEDVKSYKIYFYKAYNADAYKVYTVKAGTTTRDFEYDEGHEVYYRIQPLMKSGQYGKASGILTARTKHAKIYRMKTCRKLLLREHAKSGATLATIPKGAVVRCLGYTKAKDGVTCYKVKYDGKTGYISGAPGSEYYYVAKVAKPKQKGTYKTRIQLKWKKVKYAEKYAIYRSTARNGSYKKIATVSASKDIYNDKKVADGRQYYYKIYAMQKVKGTWVYSAASSMNMLHTKSAKTRRIITEMDVNLRKYAGTDYKIRTVVPYGKKFKVIYTTRDKTGTLWYQVKYKKNGKTYTGYLSGNCVRRIK